MPAFKTSIKKSANKVVARASAARANVNATAEASPHLRGTKRRNKEDLPDQPAIKKMTTNQDLAAALTRINSRLDKIDEGLRGNATKHDVTLVQNALAGIRGQVTSNKENIEWLIKCREEDSKKQQECIVKGVQEEMDRRAETGSVLWTGDSNVRDQQRHEDSEYDNARRSMRMWPVPEGDETAEKAARDFMTNVLDIPRIAVSRIRIEFVRRVSATRRSKIGEEVLVRFEDVGDRDVVQSYASNLAKHVAKAGIRLEIPTHLRQTFRILDIHSAELKRRHPTAKRSIKFEDASRGLVLDVKVSEEDGWIRVDPETAKKAGRERGLGGGSSIGRATPGGKAGRRALLLPSPEERTAFSQGGWSQSRRTSEGDAGSWRESTSTE